MANHIRISHLIGKPALGGGWIIPRQPAGRVKRQLDDALASSRTVPVRIRPDFPTSAPVHEVLVLCGRLLKMVRETNEIVVTMSHGRWDESSKRHRPETRTFKVGQTYELSTRDAFRVLGANPYMYAFEEVIADDDLKPLIPEATATASSVNELQEKVRYLEDLIRQQAAQTAAAKTSKKRTLKDVAAAASTEDEASEEG